MAKLELSSYRPEIEKIQEACGDTAIYSKKGELVSPTIPLLQHELQHRGQDSSGMAAYNGGGIRCYVNQGLVKEVFPENFDYEGHGLISDRAIGHNRYGTSGETNKDDTRGSQPVIGEYCGRKIALAYNGNLPDEVRQELKLRIPDKLRNSMFDTEDIANAIVSADGNTWEERIKNGLSGIDLAYSLTVLTDDGRIFGLRGPSGTWPLWYGEADDKIIFSSETRVCKDANMKWTEVDQGELVEATPSGVLKRQIFEKAPLLRCGLHDAYGAKQDSLMAKDVIYADFRRELGRELAREHPVNVDLIVGVPETGLVIAEGYAEELGRKSTILIGKNGKNKESKIRSFIAKNLEQTINIINQKFKVDKKLARGKSVLLIDDSLIRGKTMGGHPEKKLKGVIARVRDAGATEVNLAVTLSKFVDGCDMGYYIRNDQLVALVRDEAGQYRERSEKEIAEIIGADSVHFLSIDGIKKVYERVLGKKDIACLTCMGQPHPLDIIKSTKLADEAVKF
jgi:amidophosphoribosyltransferase